MLQFVHISVSHGYRKRKFLGHLGGSVVERLLLAQGVIPGSRIESRIGLPAWTLLLPLPVSLPHAVYHE